MYTQLFKQLVLSTNLPVDEKQEKAEMLSYCRNYLTQLNNESALTFLERFDREKSDHSAVWWYTYDSFLYRMLNKACRVQDIETMYAVRMFIRELHREIEQLSLSDGSRQSTLVLYRGQQLSLSAFKEIQSKSGGLLSINSFFSTSLNREVALMFAGVSDGINTISVVFQIRIPFMDTNVVPFANIDLVGAFGEAEAEYLFSFGSVFRIGDMNACSHSRGGLWFIEITLTTESDPELMNLTDYIWSHNLHDRIDLTSFARLMIDMGEHEKAEEVYATMLERLRCSEDIGFVYHQLGYIEQIKSNWNFALELYHKALECVPKSERERGHTIVATLFHIAEIYCNQSNWDRSLVYINRALAAIDAQDEPIKNVSVDEQVSNCLHMIGTISLEQYQLDNALEYFERALEIRRRILPPMHPLLATSYNDLGILYHRQKRYEQALSAYETCLEIRRCSLPEGHWALAMIFNNMANTLYWLDRDKEALEFSVLAVDIGTRSLGENHPMTSTFRDTLEGISATNEEEQ
ncbi:unnamed protein product [Adineta steineri]|uniref:Uncharacterized protein n=1 Tax=Adineta steineri TaxID=433720 RepID=A0A814DFS8_9BILA|nr:unnamed protein product [Adineta steineri]CAF4098440.1 unnamed protein product [Adineta steineri]